MANPELGAAICWRLDSRICVMMSRGCGYRCRYDGDGKKSAPRITGIVRIVQGVDGL